MKRGEKETLPRCPANTAPVRWSRVPLTVISHADNTHSWHDVVRTAFLLLSSSAQNPVTQPWWKIQKHCHLRTHYKRLDKYSSKYLTLTFRLFRCYNPEYGEKNTLLVEKNPPALIQQRQSGTVSLSSVHQIVTVLNSPNQKSRSIWWFCIVPDTHVHAPDNAWWRI